MSPSVSLEKLDEVRFENTVSPEPGPSKIKNGDAALAILGDSAATPVTITAEQDAAVLRKIDLWVMPVVLLVYFLQQLDKCDTLIIEVP